MAPSKNMEVFMAEDINLVIVDNKEIQSMIYTFRGRQVMLDSVTLLGCIRLLQDA